jgi:hypothetical protein
MKKTFFIAACMMVLSSFSIAQKYNNELLNSYTKSEIQSMDVETLQALEYGIENAIYFITIPKEKQSNFLVIKNPNSTTKYTSLGLKITSENQYFEIKETNQLMVVKSLYVLKNELLNKNKN